MHSRAPPSQSDFFMQGVTHVEPAANDAQARSTHPVAAAPAAAGQRQQQDRAAPHGNVPPTQTWAPPGTGLADTEGASPRFSRVSTTPETTSAPPTTPAARAEELKVLPALTVERISAEVA